MQSSFLSAWHLSFMVAVLAGSCCCQALKPTRYPLFTDKPFLLAWNAPTQNCKPQYGVPLNLAVFDVVASTNEGLVGQKLTIFYKTLLGLYPYYTDEGVAINGGLPQLANLRDQLAKMPEGLDRYIPEHRSEGLAVIDWEEWRPQWARNWGAKNIYRNVSCSMIAQKNVHWTADQVEGVAQEEFEASAKQFMLQTIRTAKSLRPNRLWGYYLFPDCYNHDYKNSLKDYTGRCPDVEISRNDQLDWLWEESTALYPSIYLDPMLRSSEQARQFARNRIVEGTRLASVGQGLARPVFVYARPFYNGGMQLMSKMDLVYTIGECAALGAAGVVLWGNLSYANSTASCRVLQGALQGTLGSYLLNVSTAAQLCSGSRCNLNGRCVRLNPNTNTYLHLNARSFQITQEGGSLEAKGELSSADRDDFRRDFICQCYSGYSGDSCGVPNGACGLRVAVIDLLAVTFLLVILQRHQTV